MLSSSQEHCHCRRWDAPSKPEGKAAHAAIIVFLTHHGMVEAGCHWSGSLSFFSAKRQRKGIRVCVCVCYFVVQLRLYYDCDSTTIRLRYGDTTTHSTTTKVIDVTIFVRFDGDTTTI